MFRANGGGVVASFHHRHEVHRTNRTLVGGILFLHRRVHGAGVVVHGGGLGVGGVPLARNEQQRGEAGHERQREGSSVRAAWAWEGLRGQNSGKRVVHRICSVGRNQGLSW